MSPFLSLTPVMDVCFNWSVKPSNTAIPIFFIRARMSTSKLPLKRMMRLGAPGMGDLRQMDVYVGSTFPAMRANIESIAKTTWTASVVAASPSRVQLLFRNRVTVIIHFMEKIVKRSSKMRTSMTCASITRTWLTLLRPCLKVTVFSILIVTRKLL